MGRSPRGLEAGLAAETCDWSVGPPAHWAPPVFEPPVLEPPVAGPPLAAPPRAPVSSTGQHGATHARRTAGRLSFVALAVVASVLVTATLSYGRSAAASDQSMRGVLASEAVERPIAPGLESIALAEEPTGAEPSNLLDELARELEAVNVEPKGEADPGSPAAATDPTMADAPSDDEDVLPAGPAAGPGVVHLTFDDGPHPVYTPVILDVLARHHARATFFVLGSLAEAHPELIERIVAEGHTLANHAWNHEDLAILSRAEFNESVGRTQAVLGRHATPCLRPPFGSFNADTRAWAADLGLDLVLWTTDTQDWQRPGADAISQRIVAGADDGSPILLHDGGGDRTQTIEALDQALSQLSGRGLSYEPVC